MEQKILESLMEQGVLGTILIIVALLFKKFIEKLFKVVENNTMAMTKTSEMMRDVKEVIVKCEKK